MHLCLWYFYFCYFWCIFR